jgi:hypothetical protein
MKIGEAHRAQSSYLYSANTIGALIHPAPIGVADRTGKKFYWRTVPGHHCLLAEGYIGAPIYWRTEAPLRQYIGAPRPPCTPTLLVLEYHVISFTSLIGGPNMSGRLAYFHPNRLLTGLYKQETEIR